MSERDMLRRPAPPPHIDALPYGPKRQLGRSRKYATRLGGMFKGSMQYEDPAPVVRASWTDDSTGYRLGQWDDGRVFRYMETLWA